MLKKSSGWMTGILVLVALALGMPALSHADHGHRLKGEYAIKKDKRNEPTRRKRISLDQGAARVQRQTGGKILSADIIEGKNGLVYRIKVLLPSGHVRVYRVDPETGTLL